MTAPRYRPLAPHAHGHSSHAAECAHGGVTGTRERAGVTADSASIGTTDRSWVGRW